MKSTTLKYKTEGYNWLNEWDLGQPATMHAGIDAIAEVLRKKGYANKVYEYQAVRIGDRAISSFTIKIYKPYTLDLFPNLPNEFRFWNKNDRKKKECNIYYNNYSGDQMTAEADIEKLYNWAVDEAYDLKSSIVLAMLIFKEIDIVRMGVNMKKFNHDAEKYKNENSYIRGIK